jgi:hypothetical protein
MNDRQKLLLPRYPAFFLDIFQHCWLTGTVPTLPYRCREYIMPYIAVHLFTCFYSGGCGSVSLHFADPDPAFHLNANLDPAALRFEPPDLWIQLPKIMRIRIRNPAYTCPYMHSQQNKATYIELYLTCTRLSVLGVPRIRNCLLF